MFCITTLCTTATIAVVVLILLIAVLLRKIVLQLPRFAPTTNDLAAETSTTASLPTELVKYTIQYTFYTSTKLLYRVIIIYYIYR